MIVFRDLWRILDRRQRRVFVALQLLSLLMAASTTVGIASIVPFFAVLADPAAAGHLPGLRLIFEVLEPLGRSGTLLALGALFASAVVLANAVNLLGSYAMSRFAFGVGASLHVALFDDYLHRPYEFHAAHHGAELANKVIEEIGRVVGGILQNSLVLTTSLVTIAAIVVCSAIVDPVVAAGAGAALGGTYAAIYLAARAKLRRNGAEESRHFAARSKLTAESFSAVKEIIVARAQATFVGRFTTESTAISRTIVSTLNIAQSPKYALESATVCVLVAVGVYLRGRAGEGAPELAHLSFIGLAAYRLLPAVQLAFSAMARIRADWPAFENVGADLRLAARARGRPRRPKTDNAWPGAPQREIRLESVSYRHEQREAAAITDVSLRVKAGSTVGFVGANGSGKTTLVDLVAGLLIPQSGRILVDDTALDDRNRDAWMSNVAYVSQHTGVLDATVAENVALGVPHSQIDRARLRDALRVSGLEAALSDLSGEGSLLGERGARLSGGQRQRLGIARALYRRASVLIMDEATSSLDPAGEQAIVDSVTALAGERTVFIVAHRLPALQHCARIFEMANGGICSQLTYPELQARSIAASSGLLKVPRPKVSGSTAP